MDSNDTTTKASSVNLEWQNFSSGSMNTTGAIAPSLPSSVDSSSSSSSSAASSGGPSQPPPVVLPQGFLAWLSPTYYRALFDIDTNDVLLRLRYALFPFQSSSTSSTTVSSSSSSVANLNPSSNSFLSLVQQRPDWYGSVWCTLTLVAVIASGSQLAAWLNFRPELKTSSSSSSSTNNLTLLTPPVWQFDVTALSSSLMVSYAFAFWAPLIIRAGMAYLRITSNIITFPVLVCVWGYGIAPYILGALLCIFPSSLIQWGSLLTVMFISIIHSIRNIYKPILQETQLPNQSRSLLPIIVSLHLLFGLVMKFFFFTFSTPSDA